MTKIILIALILTLGTINAQNLQLHYDYGEDRDYFTLTFEMFDVDDYGSTFMFYDFDFNRKGQKSISLGYLEIARYIKLPGFDLFEAALHYNDGTAPWGRLGPVWLAGIKRDIDLGFFKFSLDLLYRNDYFSNKKDAQIIIAWHEKYFEKVTFSGFLDLWTSGTENKKPVILSEPQVWYNIWNELNVGMELEISKNFLDTDKFEFMPTIGIKWDFAN